MANIKYPIEAVLIGAGSRGRDAYGKYAIKYPSRLNFVAVAEVDEEKRKRFQKQHNISDEFAFETWEDLLNQKIGKLADLLLCVHLIDCIIFQQ